MLYAPKEYWDLPLAQRSGRCGPGEGIWEMIIPDYFLGLKVTPACSIHDWMWKQGKTHHDFLFSNRVFLYNLYRLIELGSTSWMLKKMRNGMARLYYWKVSGVRGRLRYWEVVNKPEEMG